MSAFETATSFFHACETLKGWDECGQYVRPDAPFSAQCEPLIEIKTVREYVDWMTSFGSTAVAGCSYEIHASAYDEQNHTALFFATFTAKHVGEGGPIPPTHRQTKTHYVYVLVMDEDNRVSSMQKVWNAPWAMKELGWLTGIEDP